MRCSIENSLFFTFLFLLLSQILLVKLPVQVIYLVEKTLSPSLPSRTDIYVLQIVAHSQRIVPLANLDEQFLCKKMQNGRQNAKLPSK